MVGTAKLWLWAQDRRTPKRSPAVVTLHLHPRFLPTRKPHRALSHAAFPDCGK